VVIGAKRRFHLKRMMNAIGRPDLAGDAGARAQRRPVARTEEIEKVIGNWVAATIWSTCWRLLEKADVPSGKIYDIGRPSRRTRTTPAREMIRSHRLKGWNIVELPASCEDVGDARPTPGGLGPELAEHTAEVPARWVIATRSSTR